jgi:hypothetical protein
MRCNSSSAGELCLGAFKVHVLGKHQKGLQMKVKSGSNLQEQIAMTKRSLEHAKPRSHRRVELELMLRDLVTQQLRLEIRVSKRAA